MVGEIGIGDSYDGSVSNYAFVFEMDVFDVITWILNADIAANNVARVPIQHISIFEMLQTIHRTIRLV